MVVKTHKKVQFTTYSKIRLSKDLTLKKVLKERKEIRLAQRGAAPMEGKSVMKVKHLEELLMDLEVLFLLVDFVDQELIVLLIFLGDLYLFLGALLWGWLPSLGCW